MRTTKGLVGEFGTRKSCPLNKIGQVKKWLSRQIVLRHKRHNDCVLYRTRVNVSVTIKLLAWSSPQQIRGYAIAGILHKSTSCVLLSNHPKSNLYQVLTSKNIFFRTFVVHFEANYYFCIAFQRLEVV